MKFLHLADLHIGKLVNGFSMIDDQKFVLDQIVTMTKEHQTDAVLIAGDVYDKSQPSAKAVSVFDDFLTKLTEQKQSVFMISGNHDSIERLSFGRHILAKRNIHIAGSFNGTLQKVTIDDAHGPVHMYLLPFLSPPLVRPYFDKELHSYDDAIHAVCQTADLDSTERNILVAHQFVVSNTQTPETSDSEYASVGGIDHVNLSAFDGFDYVALGHLHRSQKMGRDTIRYAGSPLKYSFSEVHHIKSVPLVSFEAEKTPSISYLPLIPQHDMREIKGPIDKLIGVAKEDSTNHLDYIHAILTNEEPIYDAIGQLREVYPHLMALSFSENMAQKTLLTPSLDEDTRKQKPPLALFSDFYSLQNGSELSMEEQAVMTDLFNEAGGVVR